MLFFCALQIFFLALFCCCLLETSRPSVQEGYVFSLKKYSFHKHVDTVATLTLHPYIYKQEPDRRSQAQTCFQKTWIVTDQISNSKLNLVHSVVFYCSKPHHAAKSIVFPNTLKHAIPFPPISSPKPPPKPGCFPVPILPYTLGKYFSFWASLPFRTSWLIQRLEWAP